MAEAINVIDSDDHKKKGGVGEFVRDRVGAVVDGDGETLALHVEHEVFTHDGQTDEADVRGRCAHCRISHA